MTPQPQGKFTKPRRQARWKEGDRSVWHGFETVGAPLGACAQYLDHLLQDRVIESIGTGLVDPIRVYELNGASAILPGRTKQGERVAGRYMKPLAPASQDGVVVGKQTP